MEEGNAVEFRWEDPPNPPSGRDHRVRWLPEAERLRENPGMWARLPYSAETDRAAYTFADNIQRGRLKAFTPIGDWEAVARERKVWARYIG